MYTTKINIQNKNADRISIDIFFVRGIKNKKRSK